MMSKQATVPLPSLKEFQGLSSRYLRSFLDEKIRQLKIVSPFLATVIQKNAPLLIHSGKRLRPYLCVLGYAATGKTVTPKIIRASLALEMLHVFALIHDDLIDHSDQRRGFPTMQIAIANTHKKKSFRGEPDLFGQAYALLIGDLFSSFADDLLITSIDDRKQAAQSALFLGRIREDVIAGQAQDVLFSVQLQDVTEAEVIRMHRYKSGAYTVERPLMLGCLLGNGPKYLLQGFSRFSLPLGIAFQIRDDMLGTFGSAKEVGKPTDSDIKEGKATLIAVHALRQATRMQRAKLLHIFGNKAATREEINMVKQIYLATGSDGYVNSVAEKYLRISLSQLSRIRMPLSLRNIFRDIAAFLVKRSY